MIVQIVVESSVNDDRVRVAGGKITLKMVAATSSEGFSSYMKTAVIQRTTLTSEKEAFSTCFDAAIPINRTSTVIRKHCVFPCRSEMMRGLILLYGAPNVS